MNIWLAPQDSANLMEEIKSDPHIVVIQNWQREIYAILPSLPLANSKNNIGRKGYNYGTLQNWNPPLVLPLLKALSGKQGSSRLELSGFAMFRGEGEDSVLVYQKSHPDTSRKTVRLLFTTQVGPLPLHLEMASVKAFCVTYDYQKRHIGITLPLPGTFLLG